MNVEGLATIIERCPDGVELVELPGKSVFRYCTDRSETQRIAIADLEDPVVVAFVNAAEDEQREQFFTKYGLMTNIDRVALIEPGTRQYSERPEIQRKHVLSQQSRFRKLLQHVGGDDRAATMAAVNSAIAAHRSFNLRPAFHLAGPRSAPRLLLESQSFIGFMLMEVAMITAHDVRVAECEHCGILFLTGALTWRRAHARFCSDKCRVAAMRARQAG